MNATPEQPDTFKRHETIVNPITLSLDDRAILELVAAVAGTLTIPQLAELLHGDYTGLVEKHGRGRFAAFFGGLAHRHRGELKHRIKTLGEHGFLEIDREPKTKRQRVLILPAGVAVLSDTAFGFIVEPSGLHRWAAKESPGRCTKCGATEAGGAKWANEAKTLCYACDIPF